MALVISVTCLLLLALFWAPCPKSNTCLFSCWLFHFTLQLLFNSHVLKVENSAVNQTSVRSQRSQRSSVRQKQIQLRILSRFITAKLFTRCCSCCCSWEGRSCGRFDLFKTGVWCHRFSDSLDHSGSMFKFRRGISRLIYLLIESCKSNLIRLLYKIMCYIWAFLSKHHPAAAHEMSPRRGRRVQVLECVTTSLECRNFCSFLINSSKEKMNLSFVILPQSAE